MAGDVCRMGFLPAPGWSSLQFVGAQYGGPVLDGACGLAASPDGNHLYVKRYYGDSLALFDRDSTTGELTFVEAYYDSAIAVFSVDIDNDGIGNNADTDDDNDGVSDGSSGGGCFITLLRKR